MMAALRRGPALARLGARGVRLSDALQSSAVQSAQQSAPAPASVALQLDEAGLRELPSMNSVDFKQELHPNFDWPGVSELRPKLDWPSVSPNSLERLGDAVYTMRVRTLLFWPPRRSQDYARQCVQLVRAETQALGLERLRAAGFEFTADEQTWLRRGRNGAGAAPQRLRPTHSAYVYKNAASLECLLGYLFLTDQARLDLVLSHFFSTLRTEISELQSLSPPA
jgi:ribonuclease-3 family protein